MASIHKQIYVRNGIRQPARKWTIKYKDENGKWRKVAGYSDRELTKRKAAMIEHDVECRRRGLVDPYEAPKQVAFADHLAAFQSYLESKDDSPDYVTVTMMRIRAVVDACGFTKIESLSAFDATSRVTDYLARRRNDKTDPLSNKTSNYYLTAVKGFVRWAIDNGRLPPCQLANLKRLSTDTDDSRERRIVTNKEFRALIRAAQRGGNSHGLTGAERAKVYTLASYSGLRAGELAKLTPADFHLDDDPPLIGVRASISKNGQATDQPIPSSFALAIRQWLRGGESSKRIWPKWQYRRAAEMLRVDLKAAGIAYETADGVFDFHALRAMYVTDLVRAKIDPKTVQKLARHSTITLTMDVYAKADKGEAAKAVNRLPKRA